MPRSDWYSDTDPRALEVFLGLQRAMPVSKKVSAVLELSEMVLRLAEANVRRLYPLADEREVFLRAASRRLGREMVKRVYGWEPPDSPR